MPLTASPSVVRAGHVLAHLAAHPTRSFTASELARALSIPRATCNSLLLGLDELGLVRRNAALAYGLGRGCIALGDAARTADPALRISSTHAEEFARNHSLTTAVSIRDGHSTRVAAVFESSAGPRVHVGDAVRLVPPFGATFVAWSDQADVEAWLDAAEPALDDTERARYLVALEAVRDRGFSIAVPSDPQKRLADALERLGDDPEAQAQIETVLGDIAHSDYLSSELAPTGPTRVTQWSSPVFDERGTVVASIMAMGPDEELGTDDVLALGRMVLETARRATQSLGGAWSDRTR